MRSSHASGRDELSSVDLLPSIDLHTGYHRTILDAPPVGYRIRPSHANHVFLFDDRIGSPHDTPHLGEFIEATDPTRLLHVARWPVLNSQAWLADTDDLLYPALCGRTAIDPAFRQALRGAPDPVFLGRLRRRVENMLTAYLHPSCVAILLRGHPQDSMDAAMGWFRHLGCEALGEAFLRKIVPVRPAQIAVDAALVERKWSASTPTRVLFCGRDFECKNGLLALKAMQRVRALAPEVEFTYLGPIPDAVRDAHPELLAGVMHHASIPHRECLALIADAHVLFHPSKYESIGIIFIEAMAAGLAVVAARGDRMDYVDELFSTGGALLVDRASTSADEEEAAFGALLHDVIRNEGLAKRLALRNYAVMSEGEYSIARRNDVLAGLYAKADRERVQPLTLADLPHVRKDRIRRMPSLDVSADEARYRESNDVHAKNVYV